MSKNNDIPELVLRAYPILSDAKFVKKLASTVPLTPDTTFSIFTSNLQQYFAIVTTDHPDPYQQSHELKRISDQYKYVFENLIKPHSTQSKIIKVSPQDEMKDDFFVTAPHRNYKLYYYLAQIKGELKT